MCIRDRAGRTGPGVPNSVSDVRAISANRMQFSVRNEPGRSARRRPLTKLTSDGPRRRRRRLGGPRPCLPGTVGRHRLDTAAAAAAAAEWCQQYSTIDGSRPSVAESTNAAAAAAAAATTDGDVIANKIPLTNQVVEMLQESRKIHSMPRLYARRRVRQRFYQLDNPTVTGLVVRYG